MNSRKDCIRPKIALAIFLVVVALSGAMAWSRHAFQQKFDLGNKPPAQVFTRVFRCPVPSNVFNIKVTGVAHMSGEFWMKFQTHDIDTTLRALHKNPIAPVMKIDAAPDNLPSPADIAQSSYALVAGWQNALKIESPEYYEFTTKPEGTGWFGVLVVDRVHSTVYAYGSLM